MRPSLKPEPDCDSIAARIRLDVRRRRPRYCPAEIARMVGQARLLRQQGVAHAIIAIRLGVPRSTLYRWQGDAEEAALSAVVAENAVLRRQIRALRRRARAPQPSPSIR
ncbi:transposase [Roseomonas sp. 18066]|uniref:transposase n=1 Tax=Roseomonas sp. 18066 TaxID=2681412 RepID=UPI00135B25C9|nr:transposase [Roseomonas sp. 18066]